MQSPSALEIFVFSDSSMGPISTQYRELLSLLPLTLLLTSCAGAGPLPGCSLDVPVYGPRGDRLTFFVAAVSPEGKEDVNLLTVPQREYHIEARGGRLYFQPTLIGKLRLKLILKSEQGAQIVTRVSLMHCQQRMSVEYGGIRE